MNAVLGFLGGAVKNQPAIQGTRVQYLSWEDAPVKGMATIAATKQPD